MVAAVIATTGVLVFGLRPDAATMLGEPRVRIDLALTLVVLLAGGLAALTLAVPGAERRPVWRWMAVTALGAWGGELAWAIAAAGHGFDGASHWYTCAARLIGVGLIPAVVLVSMLKRGAPLRPTWSAALAGAAAWAAGALAVTVTCPLGDPAHILLGHFVPVAPFALVVARVARGPLGRWRGPAHA
jgi:hypothetical protein